MMTKKSDPLTIAYMAIGAMEAVRNADPRQVEKVMEQRSGQLGFIGDVIEDAVILDQMGYEIEEDIVVCWAYEVAEDYGYDVAKALLEEREIDRAALREKYIRVAQGLDP